MLWYLFCVVSNSLKDDCRLFKMPSYVARPLCLLLTWLAGMRDSARSISRSACSSAVRVPETVLIAGRDGQGVVVLAGCGVAICC